MSSWIAAHKYKVFKKVQTCAKANHIMHLLLMPNSAIWTRRSAIADCTARYAHPSMWIAPLLHPRKTSRKFLHNFCSDRANKPKQKYNLFGKVNEQVDLTAELVCSCIMLIAIKYIDKTAEETSLHIVYLQQISSYKLYSRINSLVKWTFNSTKLLLKTAITHNTWIGRPSISDRKVKESWIRDEGPTSWDTSTRTYCCP